MEDDTLLPFSLPAVQRKKVFAAFDGGRLTSDGGVLMAGYPVCSFRKTELIGASVMS